MIYEPLLDAQKCQHPAIMHKHELPVQKRMAICLQKDALGGGAHVTEHELGLGAPQEVVEVDVVPGGCDSLKDAWLVVGRVVADSEAVAVYGVAHVEAEARVERLVDDAMRRLGEEVGKHHRVVALVDHESTHLVARQSH